VLNAHEALYYTPRPLPFGAAIAARLLLMVVGIYNDRGHCTSAVSHVGLRAVPSQPWGQLVLDVA